MQNFHWALSHASRICKNNTDYQSKVPCSFNQKVTKKWSTSLVTTKSTNPHPWNVSKRHTSDKSYRFLTRISKIIKSGVVLSLSALKKYNSSNYTELDNLSFLVMDCQSTLCKQTRCILPRIRFPSKTLAHLNKLSVSLTSHGSILSRAIIVKHIRE